MYMDIDGERDTVGVVSDAEVVHCKRIGPTSIEEEETLELDPDHCNG
jgi:hypothetical protein